MPIYEFVCQDCRHNMELLTLRKEDTVEIKCPECGSQNLERVLSAANVATGGGASGKQTPAVENRSCSTGTCSTITLPGHTR